jgi:hypothetical protein
MTTASTIGAEGTEASAVAIDREHRINLETSLNGGLVRAIVLVILILLVLGALQTWPYSASWGYYPSGGLGLVLVILVILALTGRL